MADRLRLILMRMPALVCPALLVSSALLVAPASANSAPPTSDAVVLGSATLRSAAPAPEPDCGSALITHTLSTGSAWRMCALIHPHKGLVLEDVQFRPGTGDREYSGWMRVVSSLYLAQLHVPYDNGLTYNDITEVGFGDEQLLTQTPTTCDGDTLEIEQAFLFAGEWLERTIDGICVREVDNGLAWHSQETFNPAIDRYTQQGRALEVSSLSKVAWYEYQQKVTFSDQGTIAAALGATGDVGPGELFFPTDPALGWPISPDSAADDRHSATHWHNAIYRVHFAVDADAGPQRVEQWNYETDPDNPSLLRGEATVQEQAFMAGDSKPDTWWRVVNPNSLNPDGHPRSYEIVNDGIQSPYLELTRPKVSFTNDHACQEYASGNLNSDCYAQSVIDYVASETEPLTDPVAWVNVGFHHVVRDEDQSPMPMHWQSFSLAPRDFFAQQALTPPERACNNGFTVGATGSCAAINVTAPKIVVDRPKVAPGTLLTADAGTWLNAREFLSYDWLWLRDGEPIVTTDDNGLPSAATGEDYRIRAADVGHAISVRVTASAPGVTTGTATSAAVAVPKPAVPKPSAPPAVVGPVLEAPTLKLVQLKGRGANGAPRLRVVVRGDLGRATGRVRVQRDGKRIAAGKLRQGRVVLNLPRPGKRYRITVTYLGDNDYLKVRRTFWVRRS